MKRTLFIIVIIILHLNLHGQEASNITVVNKSQIGKFFRPSLTVMFIERDEALSSTLINDIEIEGSSGKFNDNSLKNNTIPASIGINETSLKSYLEKNVSPEIVKIWFPYDYSIKNHSLNVIAERGMFNATDAEVIKARASVRGEGMLKDVGFELVNKSYILIYDVHDIKKTITSDDRGNSAKHYNANCDLYLFQLDWNNEVINEFSKQWTNPNAIKLVNFPVKKCSFIVNKNQLSPVSVGCTTSRSKYGFKDDDELLNDLAKLIVEKSEIIITNSCDDFQAQNSIFQADPIRSKVGTKEGINVNQRWFVYELNLKPSNEIVKRRKGVIRASKDIAYNNYISTGNSSTTRFYQTYGGQLAEGMLIQQKPDLGMGVSFTYGTEINIMIETYVGLERTRAYLRVAIPISSDDPIFSLGISKEFYFMRIFSIAPFIGVSPDLENPDTIEGYGLDGGVNLSLYVLHNFQIFSQASLNTKSPNIVNAGVGLRILY